MATALNAVKQDEEPMDFEIEVDVKCEGHDKKKLNLHNGVYAGKVSSFVHAATRLR